MDQWRKPEKIIEEIEQIRNNPTTGTAFNHQQNKLFSDLISVVIDLTNTTVDLNKSNEKLQRKIFLLSLVASFLIIIQILLAIPRNEICNIVTAPDVEITECVNQVKLGLLGEKSWLSRKETRIATTSLILSIDLMSIFNQNGIDLFGTTTNIR